MKSRKKIMLSLIIFTTMITIVFPAFVIAQDSTTLVVSPSMISVYPYSVTNDSREYLLNNGVWNQLKVSKGSIKIDNDLGITLMGIINGKDAEGKILKTYWYRVPFIMPFNVYTTLDKYQAIPLGTNAYKYSNKVEFTKIARIHDWRTLDDRTSCPWEYTYAYLPSWKIAEVPSDSNGNIITPGITNTQESIARSYFRNKFYFSGSVNFKMTINPELGAVNTISLTDGTAYLNNTVVRLAECGTTGEQYYGDITTGNTYVTTNFPQTSEDTNDLSKVTYDTDVDYGSAGGSVQVDPCYKLRSIQGLQTVFWNEGGEVEPIESGSQLDPINLETGEILAEDTSKPTKNYTKWMIPYGINKLYPKLTVYQTNYNVNSYQAIIDVFDEPWIFGDAGVRRSTYYTTGYTGISAWRDDNYFIHDNLGFQIDLYTTYNCEFQSPPVDGLDDPVDITDDAYWLAIIEGLLSAEETIPPEKDIFAILMDNLWQIIVLIIAFGITIFVVKRLITSKPRQRREEPEYREPKQKKVKTKKAEEMSKEDILNEIEKLKSALG